MKYLLMIFTVFFLAVHIATPLRAIETPPVDELEVMLKKIENNLRVASAVTSVAKAKGEALVEQKVEEKKELQAELVVASEELKIVSEKVEIFATRMVEVGLDTTVSVVNVNEEEAFVFKGALYDEWLEYKKNGGESEFEYYRLYKK
jgi:hypothetical protein